MQDIHKKRATERRTEENTDEQTIKRKDGTRSMKLAEQLEQYIPYNQQEAADKEMILHLLRTQPDIFLRSNLAAHMSASAWTVNPERTKVLMVYHNIYDSWSWMGGHADGEEDLLSVALREVKEESGVCHVHPVRKTIFSVESLTVDGHEKRGVYVPSHLHLNVTYLLEASEDDSLQMKEDENCGVSWFSLEEAIAASTEPWFQQRIYRKLNEKLKLL